MGHAREIVDIVLHPDESPIGDKPVVHLKYMSAYMSKLSRTRVTPLEGLDASIIPIKPATTSYRIRIKKRDGKLLTKNCSSMPIPYDH